MSDYSKKLVAAVEEIFEIAEQWTNPQNSAPVAIAVHVIAPTPHRPFYTLFTTGMSTPPVRTELVLCLPPTWFGEEFDVAMQRPERAWPVVLLDDLARYPHDSGTTLGAFHTIANIDREDPVPYASNTSMRSSILGPPVLWPCELRTIDGVEFLAVVPLLDAELDHKLEFGGEDMWPNRPLE